MLSLPQYKHSEFLSFLDLFQGVMQMERRLGGRLLDNPKQIPFQDGGHNLCLTIEDLCEGWRSKLAANYQVLFCSG